MSIFGALKKSKRRAKRRAISTPKKPKVKKRKFRTVFDEVAATPRSKRAQTWQTISDWNWFADKHFPGWGEEIGPVAKEYSKANPSLLPREVVLWAAGQAGLKSHEDGSSLVGGPH